MIQLIDFLDFFLKVLLLLLDLVHFLLFFLQEALVVLHFHLECVHFPLDLNHLVCLLIKPVTYFLKFTPAMGDVSFLLSDFFSSFLNLSFTELFNLL